MSRVPRNILFLALCVLVAGLMTAGFAVALETDPLETDEIENGEIESEEQSTIQSVDNNTNYLSPPDGDFSHEEYETVNLDASSAVDASAQEINAEHERHAFERQLQTVDHNERTELANDRLEKIEDRYQYLDQRHEELYADFEAENIRSAQLLRELSTVQTSVSIQQSLRQHADDDASQSSDFQARIDSLEDSLTTKQPVTERIQQSIVGDEEPAVVYLQSATDSLVLATVDETDFNRQTTLRNERDLGGEDQFVTEDDPWGLFNAFDRTRALYPWAFDAENIIEPEIGRDNPSIHSQIYKIASHHRHGDLTAYLDGATTNVFHEAQTKPLLLQPVTDTVSNTTGSAAATVEVTTPEGPMRVSVEDADGNLVSDATVSVNGYEVGSTNDEGTLWVVRPRGTFEVGVTTPDGHSVVVTEPEDLP